MLKFLKVYIDSTNHIDYPSTNQNHLPWYTALNFAEGYGMPLLHTGKSCEAEQM